MTDYKTPLPAILAAFLEAAINRFLLLDPTYLEQFQRLEGRLLKVDLDGIGIGLFFSFEYGQVSVSTQSDLEPDTTVAGSPAALFMMAAPDEISDWGLPGSGVSIQGDAGLARDLGKLLSHLEPGIEGPLSTMLGDTLGFQLASGLKQGTDVIIQAAKVTVDYAGSYAKSDPGHILANDDFDPFVEDVEKLRDGIDRMDARLAGLEADGE